MSRTSSSAAALGVTCKRDLKLELQQSVILTKAQGVFASLHHHVAALEPAPAANEHAAKTLCQQGYTVLLEDTRDMADVRP